MRQKDRILSVEPRKESSSRLIALPILTIPKTDRLEPKRAKDLIESDVDNEIVSNIESEDPRRHIPKTDKLLPILA